MKNQIWGFDPLELLETIEFPSDQYEQEILRSKTARMVRSWYLLWWLLYIYFILSPTFNRNKNAIRRNESILEAFNQAKQKLIHQSNYHEDVDPETFDLEEFQDHLAKVAAVVTIQAVYNGWNTRRKYLMVISGQFYQFTWN